jgi:hypothetical protein
MIDVSILDMFVYEGTCLFRHRATAQFCGAMANSKTYKGIQDSFQKKDVK